MPKETFKLKNRYANFLKRNIIKAKCSCCSLTRSFSHPLQDDSDEFSEK